MSERRRLRRGLGGFLGASVLVPVISSAAAAGATGEDVASENARSGIADCAVGDSRLTDLNDAEDWAPVTPEKWEFTGDEVILAEAGDPRPGPRRPSEYAVVTPGREFGAVQLDAQVRIDTPDSTDNRAVILVFGFESDTEYYYVHLSQDNTIYAHNGIFKVNNADRERIDEQWDGSTAAPPAITDEEYHHVRLVHCPDSGEMAVYMDGSDTPLMTATDRTFDTGRVGFGSFGNIGRIRDLTVSGTPAETCSVADSQPTVVVGDIDSGVDNREAEGGCSINDLILDEYTWDGRGAFMRHVTSVVSSLREAGHLQGHEVGAITAAAGRSEIGDQNERAK